MRCFHCARIALLTTVWFAVITPVRSMGQGLSDGVRVLTDPEVGPPAPVAATDLEIGPTVKIGPLVTVGPPSKVSPSGKVGPPGNVIEKLDFDERALGNYEDVPMHWHQLEGEGLPSYNRGSFDESVGCDAAPSFRLDLAYGNVGYEYRNDNLAVIPRADYVVEAQVRSRGLRYARAFVVAYFADRFGNPIESSRRVSRLMGGAAADEPWQRVTIELPGRQPEAATLRLQVWLLQRYVWRGAEQAALDPVVRQDVEAAAWFDDIRIHQLPRFGLRLSNPAGVVVAGERETIDTEVYNATPHRLALHVRINTDGGVEARTKDTALLPFEAGEMRVPVSDLPPALYYVDAELRIVRDGGGSEEVAPAEVNPRGAASAADVLLRRRTTFVVLPELPAASGAPDLGIDLGQWDGGDARGAAVLVQELGAGSARIGLPALGAIDSAAKADYLAGLNDLLRELGSARIATIGVLTAPATPTELRTTRRWMLEDARWADEISPLLSYLLGGVGWWQVGSEAAEQPGAERWSPQDGAKIRAALQTYLTEPRLVMPGSVLDEILAMDASAPRGAPSGGFDAETFCVPAAVPTAHLARFLSFLAEPSEQERWLLLEQDDRSGLDRDTRLADFAQRIVLAKALGPDRVFVPAPFVRLSVSGADVWQPTDEYLPLRTLCRYLAGKQAIGARVSDAGVVAMIFVGSGSDCAVFWSHDGGAATVATEYYLGPRPVAVDLWGRRTPLVVTRGRAAIAVSNVPVIVETEHAPLALLQATLNVSPAYVDTSQARHEHVVRFRNSYGAELVGRLRIDPPAGWMVTPQEDSFRLAPGEEFALPVEFRLRANRAATRLNLRVRIELEIPAEALLELELPLAVGLQDVVVDATAWWRGDELVVEQMLRNLSGRRVSFSGFCQAPAAARMEALFLGVDPSDAQLRRYIIPRARRLAGATLQVGIREIGGVREMDQLVEVPQ